MSAVKSALISGEPAARLSAWFLYLIECEDGSYYAGITTDVERRFAEHVFGIGARYTRAHPPQRLMAVKTFPDRASALRAEAALKKRPRARKLEYFAG